MNFIEMIQFCYGICVAGLGVAFFSLAVAQSGAELTVTKMVVATIIAVAAVVPWRQEWFT